MSGRLRVVAGTGVEQLDLYLRERIPEIEVVAVASDRHGFLELLARHQPEVAVFSYTLPGDVPDDRIPEMVRARSPRTRVVFVLDARNPEAFSRACNAAIDQGFYDIFSNREPLKVSALREAILHPHRYEDIAHLHTSTEPTGELPATLREQVEEAAASTGERAQPTLRPLLVSVWSPKAGSGATTVAVRLALRAAQRELKVALYDFNLLHSHVAFHLGVLREGTGFEALIALERPVTWPDVRRELILTQRVHVFPGLPTRPELSQRIQAQWLECILDHTRNEFDLSIFDLHPDLDEPGTFMAIKRSVAIVVVVTQDPACIHEATRQLSMLRRLNVPARRLRLVVNRAIRGVPDLSEEDVAEYLGLPVVASIPEDYRGHVRQLRDRAPQVPAEPYDRILKSLYGAILPGKRRLRILGVMKT